MSWIEHVKKVAEEKGISYKEAMTVAKETYNPTGETKQTRKKKSGDNNNTKKNRKSMKIASASSSSPSASSPTVEELLAQIKLCGKCKKRVDKLMKKKSLKGGNCCGPV